ncbi:major facilitator superfamily domain-containing protein [Aspergillus keveii]|uniref:Major facilitator superfamily domain-containing protein n=1 Tax=Aspergillus keveii TaxID=714993 RepID=A0ABR4FWY8_9EURO
MTMEKKNPDPDAAPALGIDSTTGLNREVQPGFKETTVPAVRFWILSVGVCLGLFLSIIDTSIVATSIYSIGVEFEDVRRVNWVALAYTLAYLGCAVTFARVSDVVGRRNAFVAAYIVFFAFSLGCGFAQSLDQLIACRTLQGIGGSGLYSLSMIILPELCPEHLRQYIGSIIGLVLAGSGALGPVLGGILTHYATWRWVFWINGPIGFVSLLIFLLSWPKPEHLPTMTRRSWKEFDYIGSTLITAAALSTLCIGYPYFMLSYAFPLRAQVLDEKDSLLAGVMLLPMLGATAVGTILAGVISKTKNYLFETMLVGACLLTVGAGLLTTVRDGGGDDAKALGFIVFVGLGFGLNVAAATMITAFEVPIVNYAPAQGIIAQLRILGGSLGISTSTIFQNAQVRNHLAGLLTASELATLGHSSGSDAPLSAEKRRAVHRAFSDAFHNDMVAAVVVSGVAILVVLVGYRAGRRMGAEELKGERVREEVARRLRQYTRGWAFLWAGFVLGI